MEIGILRPLITLFPLIIAIPFFFGLWYLGTSIFIVAFIFCTMLIRRNWKVHRLHSQILNNFGLEAYKMLPDYDIMFNSFWIPVKKYKQDILLKAGIMA